MSNSASRVDLLTVVESLLRGIVHSLHNSQNILIPHIYLLFPVDYVGLNNISFIVDLKNS
jgi:hypothetical protein